MDGPTSSSAINAFLAKLQKFSTRKERYGTPYCDQCIDFLVVVKALRTLSHGSQQWDCHPSPGLYLPNAGRSVSRYLLIAYSNPDPSGLPNHLCFCVPLFVRHRSDRDKPYMVACFDTSALKPLSQGLYWGDDRLVADFWEDFERFHDPLNELLFDKGDSSTAPETGPVERPSEPESEHLTIEGIPYRKSIAALLWRWILAPAELERAIDPCSLEGEAVDQSERSDPLRISLLPGTVLQQMFTIVVTIKPSVWPFPNTRSKVDEPTGNEGSSSSH